MLGVVRGRGLAAPYYSIDKGLTSEQDHEEGTGVYRKGDFQNHVSTLSIPLNETGF